MDFLSIRKKARKKGGAKEGAEKKPSASPAATPGAAPPTQAPAEAPAVEGPPPDRRRARREGDGAEAARSDPASLQDRFDGLAPTVDGRFATWRPGTTEPPIEPDHQALVAPTPARPPPPETTGGEAAAARRADPAAPGQPEATAPPAIIRLESSTLAAPPPSPALPADPLDLFFYDPGEDGAIVPTFGGAAGEEPGLVPAEELDEFLTFGLGPEEYAVPIRDVREVMRAPAITEVPRAPAHVLGVITVRGEVVAVLDARGRLGLVGGETASGRIVIVDAGVGPVGLLVDAVRNVVRLPHGSIEPCPPGIAAKAADCVTGIGRHRDRLFMVLEPAALLSRPTGAGER